MSFSVLSFAPPFDFGFVKPWDTFSRPITLPCYPNKGFSEVRQMSLIKTVPENGDEKIDEQHIGKEKISCHQYPMDPLQMASIMQWDLARG